MRAVWHVLPVGCQCPPLPSELTTAYDETILFVKQYVLHDKTTPNHTHHETKTNIHRYTTNETTAAQERSPKNLR